MHPTARPPLPARLAKRPQPPRSRPPRPRSRPRAVAVLLAVVLSLTAVLAVAAPARPAAAPEPGAGVVVEWNRIALRTVYAEAALAPPLGAAYLGIVQLAVYDAVVAVEGGYAPYLPQPRAQARASSEVAAVTAAHRVLRTLFPASAAALDADHAAFMATVRPGVGRVHGVRVGEAAAAAMLAARADDGLADVVTFTPGSPAPGVWQQTPGPGIVAQLATSRPLVIESQTAVALPGPDPVTSTAYAADYAEVKALGAREGSTRTPDQTATALFWNANVVQQHHLAMATEVAQRGLGIVEGARAFAVLGAATGDALMACVAAKYEHAYWRPVTAIRNGDTDGNDATVGDPAWTQLAPGNPAYPEYPSGHACATGAASGAFDYLFGGGAIGIEVPFPVAGSSVAPRVYATTAQLDAETIEARIWLGLHFRRAMTDGSYLGHAVADLVTPAFDPVG